MIGTLLTFFAVGLITLLVAGVVLSIVGTLFSLTFGLAFFLLFKVAPVLLVGWIAVKISRSTSRTTWSTTPARPRSRKVWRLDLSVQPPPVEWTRMSACSSRTAGAW